MNYVIELYVLTKQGKLWQIYLNMDENEINLEKNTLKDDYGKVLKKKKTSKSSSCSLQNLYPIIININSTNIKRKNNKFKKLSSKDYYQHNNYNKRIHITMIHQSNDLYNFCFYENYMILYSYNSCIQYIDLLSQRIASEKIRSVSSDINITVDPYTLYSTDISSISNESEPIKDFHILNLKNYNETQVTSKNQYSANESLILSGSPKKLKNNVLMIIGKNGSVLVYKIISKESKDILFNKKYHITSPIYSSCIFNNYLFITSKYYDGSRKITFYDLYNEENEEEFKEILIPKLFPSAEDIQYFKCLSIIDKNISFNQLHLNGLWTSGERDISNLLLDEKENNHGPDLNNPSKIIMPILDDINRLSTSIEEYKKDHKLLNRSIACMNETIFFLISFIDYINKNEYKELPIVLNMNINPYIEEIDSKSTIYNVTLPNLKKNEQW
ncbi:hypothetical protein LY90DRAFT_514392 [Neocallimastix californiae]|uniref:Uncharacterized protein n=1 Tax=Neocallimastix californiae TaxID=1754190 RepID=A0A1Y2AR28_9FUNG|nr:hypothetical protein LY90DRAFT_514392 [Neocallimastix californiae]|eukprot:ORY24924.1 hypothetical protein LY90DRAFT_514392 [Neocallimastix californiae]